MKWIDIDLSEWRDNSYRIYIDRGLLDRFDRYLEKRGAGCILVTDDRVCELYGGVVMEGLKKRYEKVLMYSFMNGEKSKVLKTKVEIEEYMFGNGLGKESKLVALGGGVVGDMGGYIASSYYRGIGYIQIPTTLVGQVDSSIGGKTGINVDWGKNLLGAIYQPEVVLIDPDVLKSLEDREYYGGFGEVIKMGFIGDEELFWYLKDHMEGLRFRDEEDLEFVIWRCCILKARIIEEDERDEGRRRVLNFGHTVGHSLEKGMGYGWLHGECIGVGMLVEGYMSYRLGYMSWKDLEILEEVIVGYGLRTRIAKECDLEGLYGTILYDKKRKGGKVYYSLPGGMGEMVKEGGVYGVEVGRKLVLEALRRYQE